MQNSTWSTVLPQKFSVPSAPSFCFGLGHFSKGNFIMWNAQQDKFCTQSSPPSSHFHFKVPIFHKDVPLKQAKPSALAQSHKKSGWWSPELHCDLIQFLALRYSSQLSSAWESDLAEEEETLQSPATTQTDWLSLKFTSLTRAPMQEGAAQSLIKLWLLSKDVMECAWQSAWPTPKFLVMHWSNSPLALAKEHFSAPNPSKPQPYLTAKIEGPLYCSQGNGHAWQRKCTSHSPHMSFTFATEASPYQSVEYLHGDLHFFLSLDIKTIYKEKSKSFSDVKNFCKGGSRYVLR